MNIDLSTHWLALLSGIALTSISQLLLRAGARTQSSWFTSFVNIRVITGYALFLLVTLCNLYALQLISFKVLTAWASITYIITPLLATVALKEEFNRNTVYGGLFIVIGIMVFGCASA